jgi:hypothetical protein
MAPELHAATQRLLRILRTVAQRNPIESAEKRAI